MTDDERDEAPSDEDTRYLDDVADRDELRQRYYALLQELRVVLPGVQVLLAFLLTVPFQQRFEELDTWGRRAYEIALTSSMLSVVLLLGPTILHRFGERTARRDRLLWSVRLMVVGLILLGIALAGRAVGCRPLRVRRRLGAAARRARRDRDGRRVARRAADAAASRLDRPGCPRQRRRRRRADLAARVRPGG